MKFLIYLFQSLIRFLSEQDEGEETSELIPAVGWDAVFKAHDSYVRIPLLHWEIKYSADNRPIGCTGVLFKNSSPPLTMYADDDPDFVGYQRVDFVSPSKSTLPVSYDQFNEWG